MKIKLALYEEIKSCDHIMKFIKLEFKKILIITMIEYKQVNKAGLCNSKVFFINFFIVVN